MAFKCRGGREIYTDLDIEMIKNAAGIQAVALGHTREVGIEEARQVLECVAETLESYCGDNCVGTCVAKNEGGVVYVARLVGQMVALTNLPEDWNQE